MEADRSRQKALRLCTPCLPSNAPTRTCGQPAPITIPGTSRAQQHPHTSGFRLLTKRTEFPAPARPGMAMRPAAAAAAAEGMARGASAPWTLGTERPARESSVDLSLDGCAKRRQAPSSHTQPQGVAWLWTAQEATHTAWHHGQSECVQTTCARQHKSSGRHGPSASRACHRHARLCTHAAPIPPCRLGRHAEAEAHASQPWRPLAYQAIKFNLLGTLHPRPRPRCLKGTRPKTE